MCVSVIFFSLFLCVGVRCGRGVNYVAGTVHEFSSSGGGGGELGCVGVCVCLVAFFAPLVVLRCGGGGGGGGKWRRVCRDGWWWLL